MTERFTVLLVDDNPVNLRVLHKILAPLNLRPLIAVSGQDALRIAAQESPVLVLLDINMPGMSGFDLLEELEKAWPDGGHITVAFVTSSSSPGEQARAISHPMVVDFATKPIRNSRFDDLLGRARDKLAS